MILAHGIDAVEIERFKHWHTYSNAKLLRVFLQEEIAYCLQNQVKSAERFAARFAAKEAMYKAVCSLGIANISFLAFCKIISIEKRENNSLEIKSDMLDPMKITLSITHTKTLAIASVIIYK